MKAPIVYHSHLQTLVFVSVEHAERHLKPAMVLNGDYEIYDSEGRLLQVELAGNDRLSLRTADAEPKHSSRLRRLLTHYLSEKRMLDGELHERSLRQLVDLASAFGIEMQLPGWDELLHIETSWSHLVVSSERDLDNFVGITRYAQTRSLVRIIRGQRCKTPHQLLQEWAAALQFPYYFGHNWDALDECLADLEWLLDKPRSWPEKGFVFFVTNIDSALASRDDEFTIFMRILDTAAREWATPIPPDSEWSRPGIPFRVVFHCTPEHETEACGRLLQAGVILTEGG